MSRQIRFSVLSFMLATATALAATVADYQLQTLETAHNLFHAATNATMYAEAAKQYEYLVNEENIRNGQLFYTLGNSWFMAGDIGRAILNYRRAEQYIPRDADLQHNLNAALELRTDLITKQDPHKLFRSYSNISTALRGNLFALCWLVFWGAWFWTNRSQKKEARITTLAAGLLSILLLASLLADLFMKKQAQPGVILAEEVLARKGDGTLYAPTFQEPLHSGTEFQCLELRESWWHIRLADGQTCWIPAKAAEMVSLTGK